MTGREVTSGGPGRADLHVHTTASDGTLAPAQVVDIAAARGLAAVGIADHDTVAGVGPALLRVRERGRTAPVVVPGVEINTDHGDGEVHVLGYFIDWDSPDLAATLERLRSGRLARVERIVRKLGRLRMPLSMERIVSLCEEGSVGRPHVARAMVEAGYVSSVREAFERYLARGRPAYVERDRFTPVEAVQAVRRAGGVAVLAHTGLDADLGLIDELVEAGLQGLEVYHPDHDRRLERFYLKVALERGLVVTGGSDSHGPGGVHGGDIGSRTVDYSAVIELKRRRERRKTTGDALRT